MNPSVVKGNHKNYQKINTDSEDQETIWINDLLILLNRRVSWLK